jgi:hypothetical protein
MILSLKLPEAFTLTNTESVDVGPLLHGPEGHPLALSYDHLLIDACLLELNPHLQLVVAIHQLRDGTLLAALFVFEHFIEAVEETVLRHCYLEKILDGNTMYLLRDVSTIKDFVLRRNCREHEEGPLLIRVLLPFHDDPEVVVLESGCGNKLVDDHCHWRWLRAVLDANHVLMRHPNDSLEDATQVFGGHEGRGLLGHEHTVARHHLVHLVLATRHRKDLVDGHYILLGLLLHHLLHLLLIKGLLLSLIIMEFHQIFLIIISTMADHYNNKYTCARIPNGASLLFTRMLTRQLTGIGGGVHQLVDILILEIILVHLPEQAVEVFAVATKSNGRSLLRADGVNAAL